MPASQKLLHYLEAKTGRKSKKPPQFTKVRPPFSLSPLRFSALGQHADTRPPLSSARPNQLISQKEISEQVPDVGALTIGDGNAA